MMGTKKVGALSSPRKRAKTFISEPIPPCKAFFFFFFKYFFIGVFLGDPRAKDEGSGHAPVRSRACLVWTIVSLIVGKWIFRSETC
jgi:hypothetical protein